MYYTLFVNERFALEEMFQGNASKLVIFYLKHRPGHSQGKNVNEMEKTKQKLQGFSYYAYNKYSKFLSISLEHLVEHKPLIYEEWCMCFEPGTCQYKKVIGLIDDSADVRGRSILIASPTDINSCITYF